MREKFYYLRKAKVFYPKNLIGKSIGLHRCGIVFLVEDKGIIARGTSLCNEVEDPFLKSFPAINALSTLLYVTSFAIYIEIIVSLFGIK